MMQNSSLEQYFHCGTWSGSWVGLMTGMDRRLTSMRYASQILCSFISFRTGQYKLHYYETPTNIKFVMLTDTQTLNMRNVLHQIYVNLYVEFGLWCLIHSSFRAWPNFIDSRKKPPLTCGASRRRRGRE